MEQHGVTGSGLKLLVWRRAAADVVPSLLPRVGGNVVLVQA